MQLKFVTTRNKFSCQIFLVAAASSSWIMQNKLQSLHHHVAFAFKIVQQQQLQLKVNQRVLCIQWLRLTNSKKSSSPIDSTVLRRLLHDFPSIKGHYTCQRTI
ncbi:hypothetical protein QVD17_16268 [Tagetes erecta]|uniref:Uncharacterized protein n=1 Tax=Tagetes erecta TaxID=13708 RepID=A0AAD8KQL9_TARER|nr:hypothetical protein QVD17_16268 [Tagetes erecta]